MVYAVFPWLAASGLAQSGAEAWLSDSACRIDAKAVGALRLGMTVAQARRALKGFTITARQDLDQLGILAVARNGTRLLDLYPDQDNPNKQAAVIEVIRVYDPECATVDGVHPGMLLREAEQRYRRVTRLVQTESEPREYAEFAKLPPWISVQVGNGEAGIYAKGRRCGSSYQPSARITSLWIARPPEHPLPEDPGFCDAPVER